MTQNPYIPPLSGGQTPPGEGQPPGQTPPPVAPGQTPPPAPQGHTSTDHWTEEDRAYIKQLRKEAKDAREALDAEARAKAAAAEQLLKEQGEYKTLAEKHEARVRELEPYATRYTALAEQVSAQIEDEVKNWPAEVKTFDPGRDAPVESRLEWRNKSRPLIDKLQGQARGNLPGNRPNPTPQGQHSREEMITANRRELQKSRTYGI